MKLRFDCKHLDELGEAAEILVNYFKHERVFAFYGAMGAGKTTFIKAIAAELGVNEQTSSPTFGFVNEYKRLNGKPLYHFDCYRIENEQDVLSIGIEQYLDSGNYCLIEWPEKILDFLPDQYVKVKIENQENIRVIQMEFNKGLKNAN